MEVETNLICGPDGELTYSAKEDHTDLAKFNYEEQNTTNGWSVDRQLKQIARIPMREYNLWEKLYPGCWKDKTFIKGYMRTRGQAYATSKIRGI